ncbi:MAG TPA: hypothetical protein VGL27_07395 [Negativicutes bacterium]|jgi:transcription elongation factor Elf1
MVFTFECPSCKKNFEATHEELTHNAEALHCCLCGKSPSPDIMTAYQNVGKTMTDLYGCCECGDNQNWLPTAIKR